MFEELQQRFQGVAEELTVQKEGRLWMRIHAEDARATAAVLTEMGARFATMTGIEVRDGIEINYHFCFDDRATVLTVRAIAEWPDPTLESIGQDLNGALWIEREIYDLLGVSFTGHPDLRRLILPDDWPDGSYPLRRDFRR